MTAIASPSARHAPAAWPIAARIAAVLLGVAGTTALVPVLGGPAAVRAWLGFTFPLPAPELGTVLSILANNLRMLAAVLVACATAQFALGADSSWARAMVWICDALAVLVAGGHAVIIGAGVGAYGDRMVLALLPHGPIELAAYALALALYVSARRQRLAWQRCVRASSVCVLLLAIAAPLEVFVVP